MAVDPPSLSSIQFSSATSQISQFTRATRTSSLSTISGRLRSIIHDSQWITDKLLPFLETSLSVPPTSDNARNNTDIKIIVNERAGSWYISPSIKHDGVYFKSTDGHFGEWRFSSRRLNLHLLDMLGNENVMLMIVDSTRRGKTMPDALSKTIPIWCAVWNELLFGKPPSGEWLRTPENVVSRSEHAQILQKVPLLVEDVRLLDLDLKRYLRLVKKPLRPLWVTQGSNLMDLSSLLVGRDEFHPIILCTASGCDVRLDNDMYVQGAADDAESWACGLTPELFWSERVVLLNTAEDDLPDVIAGLLSRSTLSNVKAIEGSSCPTLISPTNQLWISDSADAVYSAEQEWDAVIECCPDHNQDSDRKAYLHIPCQNGKVGSRSLRHHLSTLLLPFLDNIALDAKSNIAVICPTGKDHSVGVALAILCLYFNDKGELIPRNNDQPINKDIIRRKLTWIMTSAPHVNPSRTTLQSINAFLMG